MQSLRTDTMFVSRQIVKTAKSWLMNSIDGFSVLSSIWTETKTDGDTLKIKKKGVKGNGGYILT